MSTFNTAVLTNGFEIEHFLKNFAPKFDIFGLIFTLISETVCFKAGYLFTFQIHYTEGSI